MKDNFSRDSSEYLKFRPRYPDELFQFLYSLIGEHHRAWDCGTGNGQVAGVIADCFDEVMATDISENQLSHAIQKSNIKYLRERAEETSFPDSNFDLITVAQAIHWFQFDKFYNEVYRTLKPHGILAVIGYALFKIDEEVDAMMQIFYNETLEGYWDPERRYMDEEYKTIPFPFDEIKAPEFKMACEWTSAELIGFLNTWSAVHHYIAKNRKNPVDDFATQLNRIWRDDEKRVITFPQLLRVGKKTDGLH